MINNIKDLLKGRLREKAPPWLTPVELGARGALDGGMEERAPAEHWCPSWSFSTHRIVMPEVSEPAGQGFSGIEASPGLYGDIQTSSVSPRECNRGEGWELSTKSSAEHLTTGHDVLNVIVLTCFMRLWWGGRTLIQDVYHLQPNCGNATETLPDAKRAEGAGLVTWAVFWEPHMTRACLKDSGSLPIPGCLCLL